MELKLIFPYRRIEEFVAKAETVEDIEFIALCCSFVPHTLDDKKLHGFLSKVSNFIDSGLLNPRKASNAEDLDDILSCLVRIASLNLRKKSHFLKHSDNLVKVKNGSTDIAERRNQTRNQRNSSKSKIVVGSAISV